MSQEHAPAALLWIDFETTGLYPEPEGRSIVCLEAAWMLTDPVTLAPLDTTRTLYSTGRPEGLNHVLFDAGIGLAHPDNRWMIDPVPRQLHTDNGLLDELHSYAGPGARALSPVSYRAFEQIVFDQIQAVTGGDVWLAGSGVSHYDGRLIEQYFPLLHSRLDYRTFDIGQVRRAAKLFGHPDWPGLTKSTHRAVDDVTSHIAQATYWRTALTPTTQNTRFDQDEDRLYTGIVR